MNNVINTIYSDLTLTEPTEAEILSPPYIDNLSDRAKVEMLNRCLLRANKRRRRIQVLTYAYYLGQLIESDPIIAKHAKRSISEHYYITSIRTYYIFETCPQQIARTKFTTLNMIRRLKADEYTLLTSEV